MNPWLKIVFFALIFIMSLSIAAGLGFALSTQLCGTTWETLVNSEGDTASLGACALRVLNSSNQIFGFLGAALLFAGLMGLRSVNRFSLRIPPATVWLLPLLTLFSLPLIQASYEVNTALIPEGSFLESLVQPRESNAEEMLNVMLGGDDLATLLLNLLIVGVLPAVCEEFAFRGALQPLLAKASGNIHVGIWASAFLFSFIHFQFYGFLPRMLLGVYFGYLVVHMGSLWPAIIAHFLNNAWGVTGYFLAEQAGGPDLTELEAQSSALVPLLIAALLFTLLFWVVLQRSRWSAIRASYLAPVPPFTADSVLPAEDPEASSP